MTHASRMTGTVSRDAGAGEEANPAAIKSA